MITFNNEDIPFILKHKIKIKNWISTVITSNKRNVGNINYIFCSDDYLYRINVKYLQHYTFTDVISFALEDNETIEMPERCLGEIYICLKRAKDQANEYGHSLKRELCFLTTHGFLHLLGYDHMKKEDEEVMFPLQEKILDNYGVKRG